MKRGESGGGGNRLRRGGIYLVVLAVLAAGLWFGGGPLAGALVLRFAPALAANAGIRLKLDSARVGFGRPVALGGVEFETLNREGPRLRGSLDKVGVSLAGPLGWFGFNARPLRAVEISGGKIVADIRSPELSGRGGMRRATASEQRAEARRWLAALPRKFACTNLAARAEWPGGHAEMTDISASFDEDARGEFRAAGAEIAAGPARQVFAAQRAATAWKNGTAHLADMQLRKGMRLDNLALHLARPGGAALDFEAAVFGGFARGGLSAGEWRGEPGVDAVLWGSGIDLGGLAAFAGIPGPVAGSLGEVKLNFRGNPDRPLDAEGSLRVSAKDFRRGDRGWESLEAAASLMNRRLILTGLELRQSDNSLRASGEVALSGSWADTFSSPFVLNLSASIPDLRSLAALLGPPFDEMGGRMSLGAALSGRGSSLDGFLAIEASEAGFRGRPVDSAKLDIVFAGGEARVGRIEIWSRKDYLNGQGSIALAPPHEYSGQIQARASNIGDYTKLVPPANPARAALSSGAVQLRWQGDGNFRAHSGAFTASAEDAVSVWTPAGITVRAAGTYSPGNLYFSGLEFARDRFELAMRATVARSGLRVDGATIKSGRRRLAEGEIFIPVDLFGGSPAAKAAEAGEIYARVQTAGYFPMDELFGMVGLAAPVDGEVACNLDLRGPLGSPLLAGTLEARGLRAAGPSAAPPARVAVSFDGPAGRIGAKGTLRAGGGKDGDFALGLPFGFERVAESRGLRPVFPSGPVDGSLAVSGADLRALGLFPGLPRFSSGSAGCRLTLAGTTDKPDVTGEVVIDQAGFATPDKFPEIGGLAGKLVFQGMSASLDGGGGLLGKDPFRVSGSASWGPSGNEARLALDGGNLTVWECPSALARADLALEMKFQPDGKRTLGGRIVPRSLEFRRTLIVTPRLEPVPQPVVQAAPGEGGGFLAGGMELDLAIEGEAPVAFFGGAAPGLAAAALRITGPASRPAPTGPVKITGGFARVPSGAVMDWEGSANFLADGPTIDAAGSVRAPDLSVKMLARGPLANPALILSSVPAHPSAALVQFLTAGNLPAPSDLRGAALVESYLPRPHRLGGTTPADRAARWFATPPPPPASAPVAITAPPAGFSVAFE